MSEKKEKGDKKTRGDFFLIDTARAVAAAKRSMNEGLAYLVLASGTLKDNRTTRWSTTSVSQYAGIGVENAKAAINRLLEAGDVAQAKGSTSLKPIYRFAEISESKAFLPCSVVEWGGGSYISILKRIRQTGDQWLLALFIDLYGRQNLAKDRGLSRQLLELRYDRQKVGEYDEFDIWAFGGEYEFGGSEELSEVLDDDWSRIATLVDIGALEWTRYILESEDNEAEPVIPIRGVEGLCENLDRQELCAALLQGTSGEKKLKAALKDGFDVVLLAKRHQQNLALRGVARLTHRPKTGNSARFVAHDAELLKASEKDHSAVLKRYKERQEAAALKLAFEHAT